jgi:hypothetical protein
MIWQDLQKKAAYSSFAPTLDNNFRQRILKDQYWKKVKSPVIRSIKSTKKLIKSLNRCWKHSCIITSMLIITQKINMKVTSSNFYYITVYSNNIHYFNNAKEVFPTIRGTR